MTGDLMSLGQSVPVPYVQELVKEQMSRLPSRYVIPDQEPSLSADNTDASIQLPVISLQNILSGDQHTMDLELQKMDHACQHWGFFQLINHGVEHSVTEGLKSGIEGFFKLPMEEKMKFWQRPGEIEGYGQAFVQSEEQRLDWGDRFHMVTYPTNLIKPHLLPKLPTQLREAIESYTTEMRKLALTLLNSMAKALNMNEDEMKELFEEGKQNFRMNYYPPCPEPDLAVGLSPHSDSIGLTILLQVNDVQGLQLRKDGVWLPVKPLPNAFIVNVGDILEVVTNGKYQSIVHRATVSDKERISVGTFLSPRLDGDYGPAPSLLSPQNPPLFKRVSVEDHFRGYYTVQLEGMKYIDRLRITPNAPSQK